MNGYKFDSIASRFVGMASNWGDRALDLDIAHAFDNSFHIDTVLGLLSLLSFIKKLRADGCIYSKRID